MEYRDRSLDALKFILIIFVCIGHYMQCSTYEMNSFTDALYRLIYSFHVPTFAFLSGYFTNSKKSYLNKAPVLYETIVFGNVIWYVINSKPLDINIFLIPQYHLWYLSALIIWRGALCIMLKKLSYVHVIIVSIILYLLVTKLELWYFGFYCVFTYFPFFVIGNLIRNTDDTRKVHFMGGNKSCLIPIVILFSVYCLYLLIPEIGSVKHNNSSDGLLFLFIDRISFIIIAPILIFSVIAINKAINYPDIICKQGTNSMMYYIYHGFIRTIVINITIAQSIDYSLMYVIVYTILTMILIFCLSKFKVFTYLMNPLSSIFKPFNTRI